MQYLLDAHTHTIASCHAYSTVQENIKQAAEKGLRLIGITDHAPAMPGCADKMYFSNFRIVPRHLYGIEVYMGAELNIMDYEGTIDLPRQFLEELDFAIASLHPPCIPFGTKEENTNAYLNAMKNPYIQVIGHPGDPRYPFDAAALVKASEETGTILEVNNASLNPKGFRAGSDVYVLEVLALCEKKAVPILVGSDAHFSTHIGDFSFADRLLTECGFPESLVLNTSVERFKEAMAFKKRR